MSEPTSPPPSDADIRRQRQEALRALARSQPDVPPVAAPVSSSSQKAAEPGGPWKLATEPAVSRVPVWLWAGSVVVVIVLVVGVVLHQLDVFPGASGRQAASALVITPSLQDQDCIGGAAWSPDGQEIAVIGYRDQCSDEDPHNYNYQAGVLDVYSAGTGKPLHTILPDPTVLALPNLPAAPAGVQPAYTGADTSKPIFYYTSISWSPDGKQLALTFYVYRDDILSNGGLTIIVGSGLVLLNADGTGERAAFFAYSSPPHYPAVQWDLSTLHPSALPLPSGYQGPLTLAPAQQYSWSSSDQLVPSGSLTAATSPTAPIGNPDGGRTFTIWQPGNLSPDPHSGGPTSYTSFSAWSPDGRYLVGPIALMSALQPAGATGGAAPGSLGLPDQVIRDPALQQLVDSLHALSSSLGAPPFIEFAWSPNGRMLAAISPSSGASAAPVTLYACATGKILGTLAPKANSAVPANSQDTTSSFLAWSADGSHLLVYSGDLDTITIWSRGQLP